LVSLWDYDSVSLHSFIESLLASAEITMVLDCLLYLSRRALPRCWPSMGNLQRIINFTSLAIGCRGTDSDGVSVESYPETAFWEMNDRLLGGSRLGAIHSPSAIPWALDDGKESKLRQTGWKTPKERGKKQQAEKILAGEKFRLSHRLLFGAGSI
jgi:hypothetical protein